MDGIGAARILLPYYERRAEAARKALEERKQDLLARLEKAEGPDEKRSIGEELANLPTVITLM